VFGVASANVMDVQGHSARLVERAYLWGRHMRTLHADRSPLRFRSAEARARLAVLRAEVAAILQMFPELRADMPRRPQRAAARVTTWSDTPVHHHRPVAGRHTAH